MNLLSSDESDAFSWNERGMRDLEQSSGHRTNLTFDECTKLGVKRLNTTDYNFPKEKRETLVIPLIVALIYYPVSMAIFYSLRSRYSIIRNRSFLLLCLQSLGQLFLIR